MMMMMVVRMGMRTTMVMNDGGQFDDCNFNWELCGFSVRCEPNKYTHAHIDYKEHMKYSIIQEHI